MEESKFMRAKEVAQVLETSTSFAYQIIRQLNKELDEMGYMTVSGRVNRQYFYERIYQGEKGGGVDARL